MVDQLEIDNGFTKIRDIPIHVFRACDFRIIAREQDTLPDLINYLTEREKLLGGNLLVSLVSELDLFGLFKTRYPVIEECLRGTTTMLVIEPGLWEKVHRDFSDKWAERNQRMIPSYLVDKTIEEVHLGIGHHSSIKFSDDDKKSGGANRLSTAEDYWEIVRRLGALSRIERAQFSAKMYEKAEAADKKP